MSASASPRRGVILIADDDRGVRTVLNHAMARAGHEVRTTDSAAALWKMVADGAGDLLITDVVFPDGDGLDLLPEVKRARPELPVIVTSARNTLLTAVRATERGAFDYFPKPFDLDEMVAAVERGLQAPGHSNGGSEADSAAASGEEALPLIGGSPAMQDIYRTLARLVATDLTVLIVGESGTGKELVARALHDYGNRRDGPFVAINMAAIPRELIESELFGHERGAFTGATARMAGRFEQARRGTLFLDEVGDMPLEAQTRLLRVLQDGTFTSVGGRTPMQADARIVAATHRNLRQLVERGQFREDLYYRLNVVPLSLPPLRERREDIRALAEHFLTAAQAGGAPPKRLAADGLARLSGHAWPGNVRELENVMRRLAALHPDDVISAAAVDHALADGHPRPEPGPVDVDDLGALVERHLDAYFARFGGAMPPAGLYDRVIEAIEPPLIAAALGATRGNQVQAARLLGINRNTLRKKINALDVNVNGRLGQGNGRVG